MFTHAECPACGGISDDKGDGLQIHGTAEDRDGEAGWALCALCDSCGVAIDVEPNWLRRRA